MKKLFSLLICLCMAISCTGVYAEEADIQLYVAENGNDENSGTKDKPFATVKRAQEAARAYLPDSSVTVNIGDGIYFLDEPIYLTDKDSASEGKKMTYKGSGNAVLSAGLPLEGTWEQHDGSIYKIDVPQEFGERYVAGLYINGEQKQRAKTETRISAEGYYTKTENNVTTNEGFILTDERVANLTDYEDMELGFSWQWRYVLLPVEGATSLADGKTAVYFKQPDFGLATKMQAFLEYDFLEFDAYNSYSFLDTPGEFYYDRKSHTLYYFKGEDEALENAQTIVPNLDRVLDITGADSLHHASNIEITGLTLSHSVSDDRQREYIFNVTQANQIEDTCFDEKYAYPLQSVGVLHGIRVSYADNITFTGNTVCQMQGGGIGIYDDVTYSNFTGNAFFELASNAIQAGLMIHEYSHVETDGLTNISARKPVTSSYDFELDMRSSPYRVTDGDFTNSIFDSGSQTDNWVQIDLGEPHRIKNIIMVPHYSSSTLAESRINIDFLGSNNEDFAQYEILARQGNDISKFPLDGYLNMEVNDPAKYRYIRVAKKDRAIFTQLIVLTDDMGGIKTTAPTTNCKITNNYITDVSQLYRCAVPIEIYYVSDYEVSHNEIINAPYTAISIGWGWARENNEFVKNNVVAHNRLENVMTQLADGGHIYMLGVQRDSKMYGNYTNGAMYFSGGIYPDNGSDGWEIYENVAERSPFAQHPWASDSQNLKFHDNYISTPRYRLGASDSYIKDNHFFVRNNPTPEVQTIIDESGLEDEYKYLRDTYTSKIENSWERSEAPKFEDFPIGALTSLYEGLIEEGNVIVKILDEMGVTETEEAAAFIAKYNELKALSLESGLTHEQRYTIWYELNNLLESFTKSGIFDNGYPEIVYSDGIPVDASNVPTLKSGTVNGSLFVKDVESFRIPFTADSKVYDDHFSMANMQVKNMYYTSMKFGDVMFEFDFLQTAGSGDFPGFVLRGSDPESYMETKTNQGYSFNFSGTLLDVQRFNAGVRTVIYGDIERQSPLSGVKALNVPISQEEMNHVKMGAFNVEDGVRLYCEINGEVVVDFVDKTDGRIEEPGYLSFLAPFCTVEVGATDDAVLFDDMEGAKWSIPYVYTLAGMDIIKGKGNGIFAPNEEVTYEDYMLLMTRTFTNVSENQLTAGLGEIPTGVLTREDAAVILNNALTYGAMYDGEEKEIAFSLDGISEYAKKSVEALGKMGLLSGDEKGNFNPKDGITRAQCAKLIFLSMQYMD